MFCVTSEFKLLEAGDTSLGGAEPDLREVFGKLGRLDGEHRVVVEAA